jgi:hypothetical protein
MSGIRLDVDACEPGRPDAARALIRLRAQIDRLDPKRPTRVELSASRIGPELLHLLGRCQRRGASDVLVRLDPRSLDDPALGRLAAFRDSIVVGLWLYSLPARDDDAGAPGWTLLSLRRGLQVLQAAGMSVQVNFEPSAEDASAVAAVQEIAKTVHAATGKQLYVRLAAMAHAGERARPTPSFSQLAPLIGKAAPASDLLCVLSEDGVPLCRFPGDWLGALTLGGREVGAARKLEPERAVFGRACTTCQLRTVCTGVSREYAAQFGTEELTPPAGCTVSDSSAPGPLGWADRVRLLLTNRPDLHIRLADVVPAAEMPSWPCALPWRRLECTADGSFGPCCPDYLAVRATADRGASPVTLWNHAHMQAIRCTMASGRLETCRDSCPVPATGLERPGALTLHGGSPSLVESQIRLVEDMLAGRAEVRTPPLELCLAVTSYCNYDCVMCCVPRGTLDDQLGETFWRGLSPWLETMTLLDANGGEPFASPVFREFLADIDFAAHPQLRLHATTNGSYFTPRALDHYLRLPFSSLTISLNAATPETYLAVNRGLPWERIRENLDAILNARREGHLTCPIRYSMVILRSNIREVRAFADLALGDRVGVRYLLPTNNRNDESIMDKPELVREAAAALAEVHQVLTAACLEFDAQELAGTLQVLRSRLAAGVFEVL